MNKAILIGRLTKDIEVQKTRTGKDICYFSLAIKEKDDVAYIDCVAWEQTANFLNQFCHKGTMVAVDGKITLRERERQGVKYMQMMINCQTVEKLADPKSKENIYNIEKPKIDDPYGFTEEDLPF